jgi:two-component system sensor histidine kinase AlgZ
LIFITFLENAFKHGVSNNKPDAWVKINIRMNGKECIYTVENSRMSPTGEGKSGIGLQNVKRRLELSYPEKYSLDVTEGRESYRVQLKLLLS